MELSITDSSKKTVVNDDQVYKEIKEFAKNKYPTDYEMQKYVYDKQVSAKQYMETVTDNELKKTAKEKYPSDYEMQKYIYEKQRKAKDAMK